MRKGIEFRINQNFRLTSDFLKVEWHPVDEAEIRREAAIDREGRSVFRYRGVPQVVVQNSSGLMDFYYHSGTDFDVRGIQKWLRETIRERIMELACDMLPRRVKYWEDATGLHGTGVTVKHMRRNVYACCSSERHITIQPFLVLFGREWTDETILHEIAHYKYMNHGKEFWAFLSGLLGRNARQSKKKRDKEVGPLLPYCHFLTK